VSRYTRIRVTQKEQDDVPVHPLKAYQNKSLQHALPLQKLFMFFYQVLVSERPPPSQLVLSAKQSLA